MKQRGGCARIISVWLAEAHRCCHAVREILDAVSPGERNLFRIIERDELDRLGADPAVRADAGGAHGYHPDDAAMRTGFVASGAGIRRGAVVPDLRLENIAPLIAALLGLAFSAPDGVLLPGLLTTH
ncbi:MAG: hypothetical protein ACT4O1_11070 [Gemmatimonadota bacterium]